jgi:hypothetical protein
LLGASACVKSPTLSPEATSVRLRITSEPPRECKELGDLNTGNDWYRSEEDVKIVLRNKAAESRANTATLDVVKHSGNLLDGSGRAFECP